MKNVLRSLIMVLSLSVVLGVLGCGNGGDGGNNNANNNNDGRVVAEQYRGIYLPDRNDGSGVIRIELTINKFIYKNSDPRDSFEAPAYTVENRLFYGDTAFFAGYFEDNKLISSSASNLTFTKQ